jgi:6-phosphogluconolactonase
MFEKFYYILLIILFLIYDLQILTHPGVSHLRKCNSTGPFLHQIVISPTLPFAYAIDYHLSVIYTYAHDFSSGLFLSDDPIHITQLESGTGPRHMVIHPTLPLAFLVSELANTLTTFSLDRSTGILTPLSVISTLRASEVTDSSQFGAAEIQIHPNGQYLYVSNRDLSQPSLNRSRFLSFLFTLFLLFFNNK